MKRGDRVLRRFEVGEPLPARGELVRWSAVDTVSGASVELHQPTPAVWVRPAAEQTFIDARVGLRTDGALQAPLAWGEHDGRPLAAYPAAASWPEHRMDGEQVAALAAWLVPAVVAAGPILGGRLSPADLAVEADGGVYLRPSGVARKHSLAVPDPYRAPGEGTPTQDALYGLGVLLFSVATGSQPFSARTVQELTRQQQTPRPPSSTVPDLPASLDALVLGLLSPNPAHRTAALQGLPAPHPVTIQAPPPTVQAPQPTSARSASVTPPAKTGARRDIPRADWQVVVQPRDLPLSIRRRLAALADIPDGAMEQAAEEGVLLPVGGAETQDAAQALQSRLAITGADLTVRPLHSSSTTPTLAIIGLILPAMLAVIGLVLAAVAGVPLLIPAIAAGAIIALCFVGMFIALGSLVRRRKSGPLRRGHLLVQASYPAAGPLHALLQQTRRALLSSELSTPARVDLLAAADEIEAILPSAAPEDLARIQATLLDMQAAAQTESDIDAEKTIEQAQRQAQAAHRTDRQLGS
ncbi:MAG: hypothetical protein P8R54_18270 [Myxococcota bacterium]|nr:hypothetical protein [Myxococcota bacterium]